MNIVDLTHEYEKLYFQCLEDWSEEMKEGGNHKENWYNRMKDKGLRVKLAQDDNGTIGGMIQYIPAEETFIEGKELYFILCIWVHGHKKGRGSFQKKGMGKALLQSAEVDVKTMGAKGLAAWGISLPFFMRASWFRKQGYKKADKQGMQILLWKPFTEDAFPPGWIKEKKRPETVTSKVTVSAFKYGWCPAQNIVFERAKKAVSIFGDKVIFKEYDTSDRDIFMEWGITDALFIDRKKIRTGPPPKYEKIKNIIEKKVNRL